MAAGNFQVYNAMLLDIFDTTSDLVLGNHYSMLALTGYTPAATHTTRLNIDPNECTDGDYAKQNLAGEAVTEPAPGTIRWDATDVTYGTNVTITAKYIVLVNGTVAGTATSDTLVGYMDLDTGGGSVSSTAGTFQIQWNASGIFEASQTS